MNWANKGVTRNVFVEKKDEVEEGLTRCHPGQEHPATFCGADCRLGNDTNDTKRYDNRVSRYFTRYFTIFLYFSTLYPNYIILFR